ncbi:MAG: hypothetical protein HRU34_07500 [Richelia sp.]|nr:hypothetical protein [Richelia sp.]
MDCKATVNMGGYSRVRKTRGDNQAEDHDMGCTEKDTPCGILDEDSGQLYINFGTSSYKTRDFIVETLIQWWKTMIREQNQDTELIQIQVDNGPKSSGVRTQLKKRMVEFVELLNIPIQLLYYPPYNSKYNAIEGCWSILDEHWNGGGAKLVDVEVMLS